MAGKCLISPKVEARLSMFITECKWTVDFNQQAALVCEQRCPSPFRRWSHFHLCCRRISGNSVVQISAMSKSRIFPLLDLRSGCPCASAVTDFDHCESDTFEDKTSLSHMPAKLRRREKKNKTKQHPAPLDSSDILLLYKISWPRRLELPTRLRVGADRRERLVLKGTWEESA